MPYRHNSPIAFGIFIAWTLFPTTSAIAQEPAGTAVVDRAYAIDCPALTGIKIDGDLSDWPAALPRYSLRNIRAYPPYYATGGLQNVDLMTSADLSASFTVGYDAKEGLVYLAVIVRDDKVVVTNKTAYDTDSVQVYIDGLRSGKNFVASVADVESIKAEEPPSLRYTGIPGPRNRFSVRNQNPASGSASAMWRRRKRKWRSAEMVT